MNSNNLQLLVYLDFNATTPIDDRVLEKMITVLKKDFGNPSSMNHAYGKRAEQILEESRIKVSKLIKSSPSEILFTSGATESCNMAIKGVAEMYKEKGNHIIVSMSEHKAVLEPCKHLSNCGFEITFLKPDICGRIDPDQVKGAITNKTILVCVMLANNILGTVNPVGDIGEICKRRGVLFFCDLTQGAGKISIDVEQMNVDLAAVSAHKMYGPKGSGALYVRNKNPRVRMYPLIHGGGQERGLRGGTENVAGIAGLGTACDLARFLMEEESQMIADLRDRFEQEILKNVSGAKILAVESQRLPNTSNISFSGIRAADLLKSIPEIAASTGAACDSFAGDSNYALRAIGFEDEIIVGSVRFSLGRFTTLEQIDYTVDIITSKVRESN